MEGNTEFQKTLQEQPELPKLVSPLAEGGLVKDIEDKFVTVHDLTKTHLVIPDLIGNLYK